MKNLKLFCIVAVVMAIVPCLVHAGTLSGPFVTSTPISFTATDSAPSTESLTFPKFNSVLGTLDAVTLDLTGSVQTTATVYNLSASVDSSPAASMGTAGVTSGFTVSDGTMNLSPNYGVTATSTFGPLAPGVGLSRFSKFYPCPRRALIIRTQHRTRAFWLISLVPVSIRLNCRP